MWNLCNPYFFVAEWCIFVKRQKFIEENKKYNNIKNKK
jgi:hypothetical protein